METPEGVAGGLPWAGRIETRRKPCAKPEIPRDCRASAREATVRQPRSWKPSARVRSSSESRANMGVRMEPTPCSGG